MKITTLYKRRADGVVQETTRTTNSNYSKISTGIVGGEINTFDSVTHEGKNIGRSNETTDDEQAELEHDSWVTKKLRTGYVTRLEDVDKHTFIKPMLAKAYDIKKVDFSKPVFVQPKLDGIRCIATAEGLFSRTNSPILSCPHIEKALRPVFEKYPDLILDGELYNHDMKDDFNGIISLFRKSKNIDFEKTKVVQYHIYDIVDEEASFEDRTNIVAMICELANSPHIKVVPTKRVYCEADIEEFNRAMLAEGYEGSMVRTNEPYKSGRQWRLMKYKQWKDEEFTIKGFEEGKGEHEGLASVVVIDVDGVECKPTMTGTKEFRQEVLDNAVDYIGGQVTVKYFEKTADGSLRFPTVKTIYKKGRDM